MKRHYNLFIFEDGAGDAAAADGTGVENPQQSQEPAQQQTEQPPARKTLQELLDEDADLAKEYHTRVQKTLERRFKNVGNLKAQNDAYQESYRLLADIYPDIPKDATPDIMNQYLKGKSDLWAQAAAEKGMSVEAYKEFTSATREMERMRGEQAAAQNQERLQARFQQIDQEAQALKTIYPSFDLMTEMDDPRFASLIDAGVFTVQQAYEAVHFNELKNAAIQMATQTAAQAATKNTVNALKSSQNRPAENGLRGTLGEQHTMKVSEMTDEDMDKYIELARSGHRVTFDR